MIDIFALVFIILFVLCAVVVPFVLYWIVARGTAREFRGVYVVLTGKEPSCDTCPFRRSCLFSRESGVCLFSPKPKSISITEARELL